MVEIQNIDVLNRRAWLGMSAHNTKMASTNLNDLCSWNLWIRGRYVCGTQHNLFIDIFFDIKFAEPKYLKEREFIENGYGKKTLKSSIVKREYSFDFLTDDFTTDALMQLYGLNLIEGNLGNSTGWFELEDFDIEQKNRIADLQLCTIKFKDADVANQIIGITACCAQSPYQDAPFVDNCPPFGATIIATDDDEAATLGVQIGQMYELDFDNPYGASQGVLKVRKT